MRDTLPKSGPQLQEAAVVKLGRSSSPGKHWMTYKKRGNNVLYFDSFGDLEPPLKLMLYFGLSKVRYNIPDIKISITLTAAIYV